MTDDQPDYAELPEREMTANQLVAYNMALYRRRLAQTQERLAEVLTFVSGRPWSKATVSAAERSVDGVRVRQFDADDILALAMTLEIPIPALFLPPTEDGLDARYVTNSGENGRAHHTAEELMERLFPPVEVDIQNVEHYRERVRQAFEFYFGTSYYHDPITPALLDDDELFESKSLEVLEGDLARAADVLRRLLKTVHNKQDKHEEEQDRLRREESEES